jgi:hypothetical protein
VSFPLLLILAFAVLLLVLLGWGLRDSRDSRDLAKFHADPIFTEESDRRNVTYFPQVKQALAADDFTFLASKASRLLTRRVRKERRRIALAYLACLRNDFRKLWRLARVIASLSPQVGAMQEFARLRLGLAFTLRYEMIRIKFLLGFAPLPALGSLSEVVSRLAIRLETTMRDLGERSALTAKLASPLDGRGLDTP